jgi:hypothetical protein
MSKTSTLIFIFAGIFAICLIFALPMQAQAQLNPVQVFSSVNINPSIPNKGTPYSYGTNTVNITCLGTVSAKISSTPDGTGNLLEDNLLYLKNLDFPALTPADGGDNGVNGGLNVCRGGDTNLPGNGTGTNCFQQAYESGYKTYIGQNPDTIGGNFLTTYGVAPIDVSSYIQPGAPQKLQFDLIDWGGELGTTTLYLVTSCTQNGVVTGGSLTGNPIPSTNPTPDELTQTFPFDSTTGQLVKFISNFSPSNAAGTLSIVDNTIPFVKDTLVTQAAFQSMIADTSLAPSLCIPLNGELDSNGMPACKYFTITCTNSATSTPAGTNCPQSTARNSLFTAKYDANASFIGALQPGTGFGFLMGSDNWTSSGQNCQFTANTPDAGLLCPQNIETLYLGDNGSGGGTKSLNSTFIAVLDVPLPNTVVTVSPLTSNGWTNSSTPTVTFVSNPATYGGPSQTNPLNGFIPAPIASLTYGTQTPVPDTSLPVAGDFTNTNPSPCPSTPTLGATPFTSYATQLGTLSDGQHALHYFATDCAATEELVYTVQPSNQGNWASFKTVALNVDTMVPTVMFNPQPPANNTVLLNAPAVNVPFNCSDSGSGLAVCGPKSGHALGTTGVASYSGTATVATNVPGSTSLTIYAQDLAGNQANTSTVTYNVQYSTGWCFIEPGHQILLPIFANGRSVFKQGWNIPARFRVCDAKGVPIKAPGTIKSVTVQSIAGAGPVNMLNLDPLSDSGFHWDPILQEWIWNISTKKMAAGYTYVYTVTLNDNSTIVFKFGLH